MARIAGFPRDYPGKRGPYSADEERRYAEWLRNRDGNDGNTDSGNASGERRDSPNSGGRNEGGNGSGFDAGAGDTDSPERSTVGTSAESTVHVEPPSGKPRNAKRPRGTKGAIQPKHVEQWVIQGFSLAAMIRNSSHWAIHNPEIEVRPWAEPAAELLNKIPQDKAEQITELNAGIAVVFGIGALVYKRLQMDAYVKRQYQQQQAEAVNYEEQEYADARASVPHTREPTPIRDAPAYRPGTGAAPTSPREPLFGNQAGLS